MVVQDPEHRVAEADRRKDGLSEARLDIDDHDPRRMATFGDVLRVKQVLRLNADYSRRIIYPETVASWTKRDEEIEDMARRDGGKN